MCQVQAVRLQLNLMQLVVVSVEMCGSYDCTVRTWLARHAMLPFLNSGVKSMV